MSKILLVFAILAGACYACGPVEQAPPPVPTKHNPGHISTIDANDGSVVGDGGS